MDKDEQLKELRKAFRLELYNFTTLGLKVMQAKNLEEVQEYIKRNHPEIVESLEIANATE